MKSYDHSTVEGQFLFPSLAINLGDLEGRLLIWRVRLLLASGYLFDSHYFVIARLRLSLSIYHVIFTSCGIRMFIELNSCQPTPAISSSIVVAVCYTRGKLEAHPRKLF